MQLREWQSRFQQAVFHPEDNDQALLQQFLPGSTSKQDQLDIYRNAYVIRLIEALRSNYPALYQLLGDRDFASMGRVYLAQYPPSHASIRWFGDLLDSFLKRQTPYDGVPVLSELACFEWALRHTIDAADAQILSVERLQATSPGRWAEMRFILHPSASLMVLEWNTPQIWQALAAERVPPEPSRQPGNWILHRQPDLAGAWRSVSDLELVALDCLVGGGNFADICAAVAALVPDEGECALRSAELLRLWVEQGLISIRHDK